MGCASNWRGRGILSTRTVRRKYAHGASDRPQPGEQANIILQPVNARFRFLERYPKANEGTHAHPESPERDLAHNQKAAARRPPLATATLGLASRGFLAGLQVNGLGAPAPMVCRLGFSPCDIAACRPSNDTCRIVESANFSLPGDTRQLRLRNSSARLKYGVRTLPIYSLLCDIFPT